MLFQDVHCEGAHGKGEISPPGFTSPLALPLLSLPCLQPLCVHTALATDDETWRFFLLFKVCASLSQKEKKRSKKEKKPLYLLQTVTGLCNNAAFLSLF